MTTDGVVRSRVASSRRGPSAGLAVALLVLTIGLLLGVNLVAVKVALRDTGPMQVQALATLVGVVAVFVATTAAGHDMRLDRRGVRASLAVGATMTVGASIGLTYGVQRVEAGLAALVMSTTPILTLCLGRLFAGERSSWHGTLGVLLGLFGVAVVSVGAGLQGGADQLLGVLLLVLAASGWSLGLVLMKTLGRGVPAVALIGWQMAFGVPVLLVLALATTGLSVRWTTSLVLMLLYMGLLAKALSTFLQLLTLRLGSAVQASLPAFLMPLFGALAGVVVLGETIDGSEVLGGLGILGGVALVLRARNGKGPPIVPPA